MAAVAHGPVNDLIPTGTLNSPLYVIVWVADDPSENDNTADGRRQPVYESGIGRITLRAAAYGANGVSRIIDVTLARTDSTEIERGYTGQRGQDEQNRRARKAAVQTPGGTLTRYEMTIH